MCHINQSEMGGVWVNQAADWFSLTIKAVFEKRVLRLRNIIWLIDSDFWTQHEI